jgi:hypothetical protein
MVTSGVVSQLASMSDTETRLERSLQCLNLSIERYEQIYAKHKSKDKTTTGLNDSLSKVLNNVSLTDEIFDSAAALENRINEAIIGREEVKEVRTRQRDLSRYVLSVVPLVKLLLDIGGCAAQVRTPK